MPENEKNPREEHANWKAPEGTKEDEQRPETEEVLIKFDPNKRPGIPRGARFKGKTVFHEMSHLWDEAKAEYDYNGSKTIPNPESKTHSAMQRYEDFSNYVNRWYKMLNEASAEGQKALKAAGLTWGSKEGSVLFDQVRIQYEKDHKEEPPAFMAERRDKKKTAE